LQWITRSKFFDPDFGATRTILFNNYRSSPELVRIQHILAQALDARAVVPVSKTAGTISGDSCSIWDFSTPEIEANSLAEIVSSEMVSHNLGPRDFVILVRQRAKDYEVVLKPAFAAKGISLRNEAGTFGTITLQELLAEEVSGLIVSVLRLAMTKRAGRYWTECRTLLASLRGISIDDDAGQSKFASELDTFLKRLCAAHPNPPNSELATRLLVEDVLAFVGRERLIAVCPAYGQGGWLGKLVEALIAYLFSVAEDCTDWLSVLDRYEGVNAIPLMTIHKSKGLEYHTVIFVGLDDGAWWNFSHNEIESTSSFFVAFTRAKQRVIFTYCLRRGARKKIATLYNLLSKAGVKITHVL
jgi:Superfamily I DNA and RNA helicases